MISNQRKCLAPDRGNVTDPNGIPDCQRFGHQPPLHRMENGMDADDALNLLRGPPPTNFSSFVNSTDEYHPLFFTLDRM